MSGVKVGFYGDDFTGSSENLAQYHRSGAKARLYLGVPTTDELEADKQRFDVLGIAGTARALAPAEMTQELRPAYLALASIKARLFQYKLCSTFDSAPQVGSFGVAMDVADDVFGPSLKVVFAATPDFGRYTAFGQHFARFGQEIFRLDRHPSMSRHPSTPMQEADLIRHLGAQTTREFASACLPVLSDASRLDAFISGASDASKGVVFDAVSNDDADHVAAAIWRRSATGPVTAVAAQGLAQALGRHWVALNELESPEPVRVRIPRVEKLLVLSGSCAIQNGRQIDAAEQAGWKMVPLDPHTIYQAGGASDALVPSVGEALARGQPTLVYTARGVEGRVEANEVPPHLLGDTYGSLVRAVRKDRTLKRVVFAGGDSSSFSVKASGARSLEIAVFDEQQNSHVCRLAAPAGDPMDGLEVMLKGGQVGNDDYFLRALNGTEA